MIYTMDLFDIASAIGHAFRWLFNLIATLIYNLIITLYDLFIYLSRVSILDNDFVKEIYRKVGLILCLFMIFKLTFSLIQALIEPNKLNDKKNGFAPIIGRCIFSIVLLGITPAIFREAFKLQNLIVGADNNYDNVLYKIIVGKSDVEASSFGRVIATDLYFSFYTDNDYPFLSNYQNINTSNIYFESKIDEIKSKIRCEEVDVTGICKNFGYAGSYLNYTVAGEYVIEYNEILSLVVGGIVLFMLINYCLQISIRVFQLAYLQLIAPIPILSYISDPDGSFQKWLKQCSSTFLDLFIRLIIIYFILYFSNYIIDLFENRKEIFMSSLGMTQPNSLMMTLIKVCLMLGLFLFAKKFPELLKDLFPNMGGGAAGLNFGLKPPKEVSSFAKGAATLGTGIVAGGIAGMATGIKYGKGTRGGRFGGALTGLLGGAASARTKGNIITNAQKGVSNRRAAMQRAYERYNDDSTFWGRHGFDGRRKEAFDRELDAYKNYDAAAGAIEKELEKDAHVQAALNAKEVLLDREKRGGPKVTAAEIAKADALIKTAKRNVLQVEMARGTNTKLMSMIGNAEAIRQRGNEQGYAGLDANSLTDTSRSAADRAKSFFDNKTSSASENQNITGAGGSRNQAYREAQANANYRKK